MHYLVLASDYDGTLALNGCIDEPTIQGLERLRGSGRKLILVTGRILEDLRRALPRIDLFDMVVAENGGTVYVSAHNHEEMLGVPPPAGFIQALEQRGVSPLVRGRVVVATLQPHEQTVLEVIREQGLEYQVSFNKGAVMILPEGINKGSGLAAALNLLPSTFANVVGLGDAENDLAFLERCGCSVAVANALPELKEQVDYVTKGKRGAGVREVIEALLDDDLQSLEQRIGRQRLTLE